MKCCGVFQNFGRKIFTVFIIKKCILKTIARGKNCIIFFIRTTFYLKKASGRCFSLTGTSTLIWERVIDLRQTFLVSADQGGTTVVEPPVYTANETSENWITNVSKKAIIEIQCGNYSYTSSNSISFIYNQLKYKLWGNFTTYFIKFSVT